MLTASFLLLLFSLALKLAGEYSKNADIKLTRADIRAAKRAAFISAKTKTKTKNR